ncbi:hypothetical protein [Pseudomonas paeninsulae]|uniref:hypothetical protein n=1 Tax=Pseudomonas paeninsulae TaxID=3110772 RepID=UPI002D790C78|nr:hypothetical protein [Pseudomonas sp. IT1137]
MPTPSNWSDQAGNSVTVTSATNVTVQFANGTAEAGDYAAADQTVTIAAGSSSATLTVASNEGRRLRQRDLHRQHQGRAGQR